MSETTAGDEIPTEGVNSTAPSPSKTADNISGDVATQNAPAPTNNATSPMDVDPKDDAVIGVNDPLKIIPQNNSDVLVNGNNDAATGETHAPTINNQSLPPRERGDNVEPTAAAAAATLAAQSADVMEDYSASAPKDNTISNGTEAPAIQQPAAVGDNNTKEAAANSDRMNSPMNILAEVASVESSTGDDGGKQKNNNDGSESNAIPADSVNHNDIILSLKDSTYKTIMHQYFRKLAAIEDLEGMNDRKEEKNIKEEVFTLLKNAGGRLLSYVDDRNPSMGFIQINDKTARAIIFNDIRMRNDSKDQWAVDDAKVDLHKLAEIAASGEEGEQQLPPSASAESNQMEPLPDPSARIYHPKPAYKPNPDAEEQSPPSNYSYLDTYQLEYLKTWMTLPAHIEDPYPTEAQKARIIKDTGIGKSALYNWFVSNRTRKWKPALLAIRSKYNLDKSEQLAPFMKIELAEDIFPASESEEYLSGIFHKEGITTDLAMETQHKGARLPEPWEEHFDDKAGYFYYHNPMTGKTQWKHPAWGHDEHNNAPKATPKPPAPAPAPPAEIGQSKPRQTSQKSQKPPKPLFNVAELRRTAKFNVGGNLFEVLCSHLPNSQESRIAQMAQASIRGDVAIPVARDVELFSLCVRFMRKNKVDLPGNVPEKLFIEELDYFGIPHEKDHLNTIRSPSSTTNQVNVETTATVTKQRGPGRRGKCGECAGCLRDNCGECAHCLDMPQFGGPGVKRQRCLERRCITDDAQPPAGGRVKKQAKGPAKLISPDGRKGKEEASWEDEFAKIQEELNRKAAEAGKGGTIFGLTTAVSKKPSRTSARNAEKKRQRQASETSDDDDDTYASDQLQSVFAKGYAEYSKKSTGRKRNAAGHLKPAAKATADVQKRYEDMQKKKVVDSKDQHSGLVRGVTVRPSGKWQVQYYYCGSSRYIGVFNNKEEALAAYETVREMLGKSERDTLTKEEVSNNINLARKAAFSGRGLTYTGPQADRDSLIRAPEKIPEKMTARQKRIAEKKSDQLDSEDDSEDEENGYVDNEADEYDGRYSIKRCSAMACDQVAVFGDRCIAHRPMCSKRGCQKLVHSGGKCKTHLKSSKRPPHASRAKSIPFGIGYKFRKQFDGDLFEGEVIEVLPGGGKDRRCKYLIDGFVEDLSVADLRILAQLEVDNPVEFGKVGYRFRKQFDEGWFDGIVVKVLSRGANGKDRRVHYSADDDFEDLSLDDLRTIALSDQRACDECRSRMIYCDGTQTFCLNNESINEEFEQDVEEEAELNEVVKESRGSRRHSGRGDHAVDKADEEESPEFFQPTDNDMILSLKDPKYKEIMHKAFRKLGAKAESNRDKDEERQVKMDVFDSLKESGFRLTKHVNYRKPDLGVMVVDDAYARDKINSDISRRLESKDRWADESDDGNSDEIVAPVKSPAKYRPRVRAKTPQDAEPEESSGDESELETLDVDIVQDESKRRKLKQTCDIHGSTCTIWEALDIGPNWMCHVVPRKNGDHSPDKFFYDPKSGEKFRSFISVKRHVQQAAKRSSSSTKKRKRAASPAESVDSNFHNDICECCGGLGELLCCSTCNLVYHLECTRPTLSELPEGDWSCAFCVAAGTGVDNSEPPLTKAEAIQGMKDIEALKRSSIRKSKRARIV